MKKICLVNHPSFRPKNNGSTGREFVSKREVCVTDKENDGPVPDVKLSLPYKPLTQGNQFSPFFLILFIFWTGSSFCGTVVVNCTCVVLHMFPPSNLTTHVQSLHRRGKEATQRPKDQMQCAPFRHFPNLWT